MIKVLLKLYNLLRTKKEKTKKTKYKKHKGKNSINKPKPIKLKNIPTFNVK